MGRGTGWLDTGTPDFLLDACQFIAIEKHQGLESLLSRRDRIP